MAQSDIHPKQHEVTIQLTDGTKFKIQTTYGKAGETLKLDVDPTNHPAWQENSKGFINVNDDRVSKFNAKFGNFDFGLKPEDNKKEEDK
ncbi:MAG: 50S ribosomal protein L31 [Proteobacteria bacterium]|nr:50S ribosomal protein L31 [Pseudomonadota bacterium]